MPDLRRRYGMLSATAVEVFPQHPQMLTIVKCINEFISVRVFAHQFSIFVVQIITMRQFSQMHYSWWHRL